MNNNYIDKGSILFNFLKNTDLPDLEYNTRNYEQVNIKCDGKTWIDTGYYPNEHTKIICSYTKSTLTDSEALFGTTSSTGDFTFGWVKYALVSGGNRYQYGWGNTNGWQKSGIKANLNTSDIINADGINWTLSTSNQTLTTFTDQTFTCPYSLYLFNINNNTNYPYKSKFEYMQIWENNILMMNLIGVKDLQTNEIVIMDTVRQYVFPILGGGTFKTY